LRLWLPPLAAVRNDAEVSFEVLDKQRQVQHRAVSAIGELPKNIDCEVVLHPADVVLLDIRPPKLSGSRLAAALPSLVEDRVVGNVDDVHVVATPTETDGTAVAAVVDRGLLRRVLDLLARNKQRVVAAVPNPLALKFDPHRWHVRIRDTAGSVRTGPVAGTGFASDVQVPVELQLLMKQTLVPPQVIEVDGDCDPDTWSEVLGVPVSQVAPGATAPPVVLNLLQYQFAPGFAAAAGWRVPGILAAVLLAVMLAGLNLHAWSLRAKETALRAEMTAIVRDAIPGVTVVLDPLAQMQQQVDQLRARAGIGSDEFLALALALGELVEGDSVDTLEYRDRVLSVEFVDGIDDSEAKRQSAVERAAALGLELRFSDSGATLRRRSGA